MPERVYLYVNCRCGITYAGEVEAESAEAAIDAVLRDMVEKGAGGPVIDRLLDHRLSVTSRPRSGAPAAG